MTSVSQIKKNKNKKKGFSLVEITLVVFITVVISSVVIFKYNDFSDSIELENIALDVILSVREAQVFGISSRGTTTPESFFFAYGVRFASTSADIDSFISFVDSEGDNLWYDTSGEQFRKVTFKEGYKINKLCVANPTEVCGQTELDILFKRPDVNAIIKTGENATAASSSRIELISPSGATTSVNISESGQVYMN